MRVVFDTNILVSAFALPGGRAELAMERVLDGPDELATSRPILMELAGVLAEKFRRNPAMIARTIAVLSAKAIVVESRIRIAVLADEPDNRILECAVAGEADAIVTGDKAMLALKAFRGVRVLSLRQYLESE